MQKVYVSDEEKEKIMDKLSRDTEVRKLCRGNNTPNIISLYFDVFYCAHIVVSYCVWTDELRTC